MPEPLNDFPEFNSPSPTLAQVIRDAINSALMNLNTWMPAVIVQVRGNQQVDIQPLLMRKYINQKDAIQLPAIQNVMVSMPMGASYSIKIPVAVGDIGIALFCQRSLDKWAISDGGPVNPADSRHHDLSDPIFIPGLYPFGAQTTDTTTDLILTNGNAQMRLTKSGILKLSNAQTDLNQLLQALIDKITNLSIDVLGVGPMQGKVDPVSVSQLSSLASQINGLLKIS